MPQKAKNDENSSQERKRKRKEKKNEVICTLTLICEKDIGTFVKRESRKIKIVLPKGETLLSTLVKKLQQEFKTSRADFEIKVVENKEKFDVGPGENFAAYGDKFELEATYRIDKLGACVFALQKDIVDLKKFDFAGLERNSERLVTLLRKEAANSDTRGRDVGISQITGGGASIVGGSLAIAGVACAPVTMGTSLILTGVGISVGALGGITAGGAGMMKAGLEYSWDKDIKAAFGQFESDCRYLASTLQEYHESLKHLREEKGELPDLKSVHKMDTGLNMVYGATHAAAPIGVGIATVVGAKSTPQVTQVAKAFQAANTTVRSMSLASKALGATTGAVGIVFGLFDLYLAYQEIKARKERSIRLRSLIDLVEKNMEFLRNSYDLAIASAPSIEEADNKQREY